jgi:hypothetical protein
VFHGYTHACLSRVLRSSGTKAALIFTPPSPNRVAHSHLVHGHHSGTRALIQQQPSEHSQCLVLHWEISLNPLNREAEKILWRTGRAATLGTDGARCAIWLQASIQASTSDLHPPSSHQGNVAGLGRQRHSIRLILEGTRRVPHTKSAQFSCVFNPLA